MCAAHTDCRRGRLLLAGERRVPDPRVDRGAEETAMTSWSWQTAPLGYGDLCAAQCGLPRLRGGQVVNWVDGRRYHVACLLTQLSLEVTQELPKLDLELSG